MSSMTPIAVTIAGSDPSGGAGIQADLKTFSALGVYGATVITALTAQNTTGVQGVHDVPADFIAAQIDSVFSDLRVGAVKIGMVSRPAAIEAIAAGLARHEAGPVVLDPVMVATSGDRLIDDGAIALLRERLFLLAAIVTPNLPEAAALLGDRIAESEAEAEDQARRLLALGPRAVLVKGGHGTGPESTDVLVDGAGARRFTAARLPTRNTHGTGCTLSSAIAAQLARDATLDEAVGEAKAYLTRVIAAADQLAIGHGAGPVHHFHGTWG
jgi:hydroxymethylpyrimidine/phosphomethylpyrimidine kinase